MIVVENLIKKYDDYTVLDGLNFVVDEKDIFGYIGPNGAGKTTTIRILTGILKPDSGRVIIAGYDILKDTIKAKKFINALPESNGYYEWMTAGEYIDFFSKLYGIKNSKNDISKLLDKVGLRGKENQLIHTFSRGMKQRLGIARAILNKPKVLFLDEPTNGLDPEGRRDIQNLLIFLNKEYGITIFFSTHLLNDVEKLCNKIAIVNYGKIVEIANIKDIKGKVEDIFFMSIKEKMQ